MEIEDFLPKYPNINNDEYQYLNPYSEDFYKSIFQKKEFYDLRLNREEETPSEPGVLLKHQKIIARFLSSYTLYDSLLLFHETGSGKTCSAVGAIEQIKEENSDIDGAVILAKGTSLIDKFKDEILNKCTKGQYIPENSDILEAQTRITRENKNLRKFYEFATFDTFRKQKLTHELIKEYSNKIIVIDEVHNIREQDEKNSEIKVYKFLHDFLHKIQNSKILLMSATPMKDNVAEIADIMNLILPMNEQLDSKTFHRDYISDKKNVDDLKAKFKGRVSYVTIPKISKRFITNKECVDLKTNPQNKIQKFKIFFDKMKNNSIQNQVYLDAYKIDTENQKKSSKYLTKSGKNKYLKISSKIPSLYSNSVQASLFVDNKGQYGTKLLNISIPIKQTDIKNIKKIINNCIGDGNFDNKLDNLRKHSIVYANVIENLHKNKKKLAFVYSNLVNGSGLILFHHILNKFGINSVILLDDKTITSKIAKFNSDDNKHGKHIQVILGSKKISEGYTFKNIQTIHILTPFWNYTETVQAIARGIRLFSHEALGDEFKGVDIYQHAAVPVNKDNKCLIGSSIDYHRYAVSEKKDIEIKYIERIMKESSFDCGLTFQRNINDKSFANSRECEYTDCDYRCDGIPQEYIDKSNPLTSEDIDISTYQLYYNQQDIKNIMNKIMDFFRINFFASLSDLYKKFKNYLKFDILGVLYIITSQSIPIHNKYGIISYLREDKDIYFLVNDISIETNYLSYYYTECISILDSKDFQTIIDDYYVDSLPYVLKIMSTYNKESIGIWMENLPTFVKQFLIKQASEIDGEETLASSINNIYRETDTKKTKDEIMKVVTNNYGYFGITEKDDFKILQTLENHTNKIDQRKVKTGRKCSTYKKDELTDIIKKFNVELSDFKNKKDVCKKIKELFTLKNLLITQEQFDQIIF